jgi:hypothetical protein
MQKGGIPRATGDMAANNRLPSRREVEEQAAIAEMLKDKALKQKSAAVERVGPAKVRNPVEKAIADKVRKEKNAALAFADPNYEMADNGELVRSGRYWFNQTPTGQMVQGAGDVAMDMAAIADIVAGSKMALSAGRRGLSSLGRRSSMGVDDMGIYNQRGANKYYNLDDGFQPNIIAPNTTRAFPLSQDLHVNKAIARAEFGKQPMITSSDNFLNRAEIDQNIITRKAHTEAVDDVYDNYPHIPGYEPETFHKLVEEGVDLRMKDNPDFDLGIFKEYTRKANKDVMARLKGQSPGMFRSVQDPHSSNMALLYDNRWFGSRQAENLLVNGDKADKFSLLTPSLYKPYTGKEAFSTFKPNRRGGTLSKYQQGGEPRIEDYEDRDEYAAAMQKYLDGVMNGDTQYFQSGYNTDGFGQRQAVGYNSQDATYGEAEEAEQYSTTNPMNNRSLEKLSRTMLPSLRGLVAGASEISGRVARNRQNKYDYMQQTSLGQMNPISSSFFQPNPYSMYAKYGGRLRKYQNGGNIATKSYHDKLNSLQIDKSKILPNYRGFTRINDKPSTWSDSFYYKRDWEEALNMTQPQADHKLGQAAYTRVHAENRDVRDMAGNEEMATLYAREALQELQKRAALDMLMQGQSRNPLRRKGGKWRGKR